MFCVFNPLSIQPLSENEQYFYNNRLYFFRFFQTIVIFFNRIFVLYLIYVPSKVYVKFIYVIVLLRYFLLTWWHVFMNRNIITTYVCNIFYCLWSSTFHIPCNVTRCLKRQGFEGSFLLTVFYKAINFKISCCFCLFS